MASLTSRNVQKNNQEAYIGQEQNTALTSFKGSEALKNVLQAQENMRVPKTVTGLISFKGNPAKKNNQIASIASEYQGLPKAFDGMYKIGGLANVAGEASIAFKNEGMDIRTFIPYHSKFIENNTVQKADGGIFVRSNDGVIKRVEDPATYDLDEEKGETFVMVAGVQKSKEDPETGEIKISKSADYLELKRTNISGSVPYLDEVDKTLAQKEEKYTLFELKQDENKPKIYVVHTEGLANLTKAYGGDDGDAYYSNFDREYANFTRAIVGEILPKMSADDKAKEAYGDFNPAGYWLHDRFAFPAMLEASKRAADGDEYFSGLRMHATYHNPGRDYQGHYDNPLDFIKTIGAVEILDTLAQNDEEAAKRVIGYTKKVQTHREKGGDNNMAPIQEILTKEEYEDLVKIFEPYVGQFRDEKGSYNMSLIPHVARKTNAGNFTHGTVSMNYGKEMINKATPEIALGITSILKEDEDNMVNITNGSYAVSLGLDSPQFNGVPGLDKLAQSENGYTPLVKGDITSADELDKVKKANVKWAINAVSEGFKQAEKVKEEKGKSEAEDTLKEFFFADGTNSSSSIIGSMSPYEEGDRLFFGWGRGVEQKGIPTTLEAFKQFFLDETIDEETKKHTKLILGAGTWKEEDADWQHITRLMDEIAEIDGGKYANNVVYVNGRISNKLAACADFTVFTSRYEPCGITPLESYSAGTPVISIATGGAPDFIADGETGFLTKHAFYTDPQELGGEEVAAEFEKLSGAEKAKKLDDYRIEVLGKETKDCIVRALKKAENQEEYKEMAFKCFEQKVEWDENKAYNGNAKSANERYFSEAFGVKKEGEEFIELSDEAHPTEQMNYATGEIKTKEAKEGEKGRIDASYDKLRKKTIAEVKPVEETKDEKPVDATEEEKPVDASEEVEPTEDVEKEKPQQTEGDKKGSTGKKVATGVGIAALVVAIGAAFKKFFGGGDKKAKKAGSVKVKTPKAPKPSTAKAKTEAPAVKSEVKKEAKDFSKYLK